MAENSTPNALLGSTARWTAAVRAQESAREDRLFDDPWAAALAGEEGMAWLSQRQPGAGLPMVLRTRYFDDFVQRLAFEEGLRQFVLPGAGLDTRAFRLPWPAGTQLFELDQPAVLRYKGEVLASAGARPANLRHVVEADLTQPWADALVAAGFDAQEPTGWMLEGFLFYLAHEHIAQVVDQVTSLAAPGSWLGFDIVNAITLTFPLTKPWVDMQTQAGAPWLGTLEDPVGFLAERGWQATLTQAGAPDANHGRWTLPVIPTTMPAMPHNWFVTAKKL
jgi:methyltransferase (TIGR00027 family)